MKKINKYDWVRVWIAHRKKIFNAIIVDKYGSNTFIVYVPDDDFFLFDKGIFSNGSHYIGIVKSDIVEVYE